MEKIPSKSWESAAFNRKTSEWEKTTLHSYDHTLDDAELQDLIVSRAAPTKITPTRRGKAFRSDARTLVAGDAQIPFHDEQAFERFQRAVVESQPDNIVFVGDMVDLPSMSRFAQRPEWVGSTQAAIDQYHNFLAQTRSNAPDANISVVHGNHEQRMDDYVRKNAAEVLGLRRANAANELAVLTLQYLVRYDDLEVNSIDGYPNGTLWLEDNLKAVHGTNVAKGGSNAAKYLREERESTLYGHCFDEATELLTRDGWKFRSDLTLDDEAVTMNLSTGELEYNKILSFSDYDNYTELYSIESRNSSLLVTDKHGLVDFESGKPVLFDAKDFNKKSRRKMALNGVINREGVNLTDDEIRLVVWVAADGHLEGSGSAPAVRWHLKKQRKVFRLTSLLDRMNIDYSIHKTLAGGVKIRSVYRGTFLEELFELGNKLLPEQIRQLNKKQSKVMLDEYTVTDGNRNEEYPHAGQISTSKEHEADIIQEVLVTNGIMAIKTRRRNSYIISFNENKQYVATTSRPAKLQKYSGKVWCVTVDNHTLLVRRNGKTTITQNTHRQELAYRTFPRRVGQLTIAAASPGCLALTDGSVPGFRHTVDSQGEVVKRAEDWQQGILLIDHNGDNHHIQPIMFQEDGFYLDGKRFE